MVCPSPWPTRKFDASHAAGLSDGRQHLVEPGGEPPGLPLLPGLSTHEAGVVAGKGGELGAERVGDPRRGPARQLLG